MAGGFPEAVRRAPRSRARFFDSYGQSIVDRDVATAGNIAAPGRVGTLLRVVAARSAAVANYESLGRELQLDGKTIKTYLDVLERLYLIRVRQPWCRNLGRRQVKSPKLYVADSGLLSALTGADDRRVITDDDLAGSILETFVAIELERQAAWSDRAYTFWHFRDGDRKVDIVIESPSGDVVGIEVKFGARFVPRALSGLVHLRDNLGKKFVAGIVMYAGAQTIAAGDRLWAVPVSALWSPPTGSVSRRTYDAG